MNDIVKQNPPPVRLKGVGDSLWVTLDPHQPMDVLEAELTKLFERLKHLAVNAKIVIDPGQGDEYEDLIETLGKFLKEKFHVGETLKAPQKKQSPEEPDRSADIDQISRHERSDVLMLAGRIRSGQKIKTPRHVVLLGNVNPGGEIISGGDILVMGTLGGTVSAGYPKNENSVILALDFRPTQIQIGGVVAAGLPPSPKKVPEYAHVENGRIIVADYLKEDPFGKLPCKKYDNPPLTEG